jgi:hypothetical protein
MLLDELLQSYSHRLRAAANHAVRHELVNFACELVFDSRHQLSHAQSIAKRNARPAAGRTILG